MSIFIYFDLCDNYDLMIRRQLVFYYIIYKYYLQLNVIKIIEDVIFYITLILITLILKYGYIITVARNIFLIRTYSKNISLFPKIADENWLQ